MTDTIAEPISDNLDNMPLPLPVIDPKRKVVVLLVSEDGGAGKSTVAGLLADQLRTTYKKKVALFDGDGLNGSTIRMFGTRDANGDILEEQDPLVGAGYYSLRFNADRDQVINTLSLDADYLIHDLPGGSLADLMRIQDAERGLKRFLRTIDANGARVVFVHLLTPDDESTISVAAFMDELAKAGDLAKQTAHIAIVNEKESTNEVDFELWMGVTDGKASPEGGNTRKRFLASGGAEMRLPVLERRSNLHFKRLNVPYSQGVDHMGLTINEQSHVRNFIEDFRDNLRAAGPNKATAAQLLGLK